MTDSQALSRLGIVLAGTSILLILVASLASLFLDSEVLLVALGGFITCILLALIAFRRLEWAFLVFAFYVPLHPLVMQRYLGSSTQVTTFSGIGAFKDVLLIVLVVMWLLRISLESRYRVRESLLNLPVITFVTIAGAYSLGSGDAKLGFWGFRSAAEFTVVFFLASSLIRTRKLIRQLCVAVLLGGLVLSVLGFYRLLGAQIGYGYEFGVMPEHIVGRLTVYGDELAAGSFGTYVSIVVVFALGLALFAAEYRASRWFGVLLWILLPLAGIDMFFTFSRRAWVGALCGVVVLLLLSRKTRVIFFVAVLFIVTSIFGLIVHPRGLEILMERMATISDPSSISNAYRIDEWTKLIERASERFWLGDGLGVVGPVSILFNVPGGTNTHNYYLMLLVEMGALGLLSFLLVLSLTLALGVSAFRHARDGLTRAVSAAALACVVTLAIQATFSVVFENYPFNFYFWFFAGLLVAIRRLERRRQRQEDHIAAQASAVIGRNACA